MSELGQHLKEVREQKQISLDDLQRTTKIQKRYLVAIEEGRFDTLPGLFYARAFVKTYAEAIGLDPEQLFDQYRNELPNPQREAVTLPSRSERTNSISPKQPTKRKSILPVVLAIAIIGIILYSVWLFAQGQGGSGAGDMPVAPNEEENVEADFSDEIPDVETNLDEPSEPEAEPEEEPTPEVVEPETEISVAFVKSEGIVSYFELKNGQFDDIRLKMTGNSYIDVKNGLGKTFYSGQPTAGEELVLENLASEEQLVFNFGASQNVSLFIAGEKIERPLEAVHQKIAITISE